MPAQPAWLTTLLETTVSQPILSDPRTLANPGTFLGWPKGQIFIDVIGFGQADFDAPVGHLSGADRALLYAKYNQPRHLDELRAAFAALLDTHPPARPTVIDVGCGPFTAGLAFAATIGPALQFRYFGLDTSTSMCALGKTLFDGARATGAIHNLTTCWFGRNLDDADFGYHRNNLTIVVASYLLASSTLDAKALVAQLLRTLSRVGDGPVAVLYTNSAIAKLNEKYGDFSAALSDAGFQVKVDATETFYETKSPKDLRYALFFRPANPKMVLTKDSM